MCIYVQSPMSEPVTYLVHATPPGSNTYSPTAAAYPAAGYDLAGAAYAPPNNNASAFAGVARPKDLAGYASGTVLPANEAAEPYKAGTADFYSYPYHKKTVMVNGAAYNFPSKGTYTNSRYADVNDDYYHTSDQTIAYDAALAGVKGQRGYIYKDQVLPVGSCVDGTLPPEVRYDANASKNDNLPHTCAGWAAASATAPNGMSYCNRKNWPDIISTYGFHPDEMAKIEAACPATCGVCSQHMAASGYSKTPLSETDYAEMIKTGSMKADSHAFGYGTCQWIKSTSGKPGEACSSIQSYVRMDGYAFISDTGSLECGRLTAIDNEYGEKPIAFDAAAGSSATTNSMTSVSAATGGEANVARDNLMPASTGSASMDGRASTLTVVAANTGGSPVYRCPYGSPAKTLGQFVSKRMLIAGCMNPSDALFDVTAEVHVPAYCKVWADYKKGCLIPWATNFDPTAKQSGKCTFATVGCTSPTALNYNSEASIQDTVNDCIEPVYGCTVNSDAYGITAGVYGQNNGKVMSADTPMKDSLYFGTDNIRQGHFVLNGKAGTGLNSSTVRSGIVSENLYNGPVVKNYNSAANVNTGCEVAIEGCMDPEAANFDPKANYQSWSWCVPKVVGCMMPTESAARAGYENPAPTHLQKDGQGNTITGDKETTGFQLVGRDTVPVNEGTGSRAQGLMLEGRPHSMDGLGWNFSIMTTVHDPKSCIIARHGCNIANRTTISYGIVTAINYDPSVTVNTNCYFRNAGCLNPMALNFGCTNPDATAECFPGFPFYVTEHLPITCKYPWDLSPSPPTPPPPATPPGGYGNAIPEYEAKIAMAMGGTVETWTDERKAEAATAMKAGLGMDPIQNMTVSITAGSVNADFAFVSEDATAVDAVMESASATLTDATAVGNLLGSNFEVLSTPTITKSVTYKTEEVALGVTILTLIIIGALCLVGCIVLGIVRVMRRRRAKAKATTYPA